jgi:hypothetical protein
MRAGLDPHGATVTHSVNPGAAWPGESRRGSTREFKRRVRTSAKTPAASRVERREIIAEAHSLDARRGTVSQRRSGKRAVRAANSDSGGSGGLRAPAQSLKLSFGSFDADSCLVCLRLGVIRRCTLPACFRLCMLSCVCRGASRVPQLALFGA